MTLKPGEVSHYWYGTLCCRCRGVAVSEIVKVKKDDEVIELKLNKINKGRGYGGIKGKLANGVRLR